ncbi:TetR/AcrR family transcriptional regulator [Paeniglutamicibacter sulfureus]|uniref:AcrR family transcriptional regulator n=1 Tax=Paeniglutamicibacter sulfureus TaxID=43666 RepID=A0ABU2BKM9_9MICC|nr:TetR/AcrR family transcriptional regulator [Paeniglutamicibacter sulfureus]MDR7358796.1 AcrR family transcriptional regulator [Paeniglutamicibacter sulfureus]
MTERTSKSAATRQRFVDEALRLFKDKGYEQTSMAQIASAAGGSRANLYLYFNSKPQIIMSRMQEIEAEVADLYAILNQMPDHTPDSMRQWLEKARLMWVQYAAEFEAINRAMAAEPNVLDEWLGLLRRIASVQTTLYNGCQTEDERQDREVHMATLMTSLERNFYFLYIRGHNEREDRVLASLARQWANLFGE